MKDNIHPNYVATTVTCACGNVIETASTTGDFRVDVCNMCHPFYTGKQKRSAAAGAVEKFNKRYKRKAD
jgi:large subunit ribosomal protein L31